MQFDFLVYQIILEQAVKTLHMGQNDHAGVNPKIGRM
jgi:hypothetical protein